MLFKQLNLRKAFAATNLFLESITNKTIGFLTEPYSYKNKLTNPGANFSIFPETTQTATPRAALVIPRYYNAVFLPNLSNPDCSVCLLKQKRLLLVSAYFDQLEPLDQPWIHAAIRYAKDRNYKLLFCADTNAHSELYGHETDDRGEIMENIIFEHDLHVENKGRVPTFSVLRNNTLASSIIDVTLSWNLSLSKWVVETNYDNGSDHNTISFESSDSSPAPSLVRPWIHCKWDLFSRILSKVKFFYPKKMSQKKIDNLTTSLYEHIDYALNKACPLRKERVSKRNIRWFSDVLKEKANKVSKQYHIAKRCMTTTENIKYKIMRAKFRRACRIAKKKAWRDFTFKVSKETKMAKLVKILQRKEKQKLYTLHVNGANTEPGRDTLQALFDTHFPFSTPIKNVSYTRDRGFTKYIKNNNDIWINEELVVKAMALFQKKKSPGPDGLKPIIFEHLPTNVITFLTFIYKCCIQFHYTPKAWRKTKVIFIPKPGKKDYTLPKSFRPISLSNYFLKTLERLVCWRMDTALARSPIHSNQHGFSKGKCTESAISNTVNYIEKYIFRRDAKQKLEHCLAVFLDISSAFDSISIDYIKKAMLKHDGDPDLVNWYHDYLGHRDLYAELHHDSIERSNEVGFPQGGVCSARFWLIAFDRAIQIINNLFVEGNGYADDCCILIGGRNERHMVAQLQRVINKLTEWGRTCGLHFNPAKTEVVLFTRTFHSFTRHIYVDNNRIPYSTQAKYLGVILDSRLTWRPHILDKIAKAKRFLHMVAHITRDSFGPKPRLMRWAYRCIVRPMIIYGAMCWAHETDQKGIKEKLSHLNRLALKTYCNFPPSTPTKTLEIMTDTMPLDLYIKKEGLSTRIRLQNLVSLDWGGLSCNLTHSVSHLAFWDQLIADCNLEECIKPTDRVDMPMPLRTFTVDTESFNGNRKFLSLSKVNVYTDGSKQKNNRVGSGFYIQEFGKPDILCNYRLPNTSTVFQAEIFAIHQAAIKLQSFPNVFIKIFVDSQAALLALNNKHRITSRLVGDTIHNLNLVPGTVRLVWIKAHVGHEGNEKADELAKEGTLLEVVQSNIAMPHQVMRSKVMTAFLEIWHYEWDKYSEARQSKQFYSKPDPIKAKYVYKLSRKKLGRFIRIITGHNNLNYHRSNINPDNNQTCRFCQISLTRESFFHFATECPSFALSRREIFGDMIIDNEMEWSVQKLLDFSDIPAIDSALGGRFNPELQLNRSESPASELEADAQRQIEDDDSSDQSESICSDTDNETSNQQLDLPDDTPARKRPRLNYDNLELSENSDSD